MISLYKVNQEAYVKFRQTDVSFHEQIDGKVAIYFNKYEFVVSIPYTTDEDLLTIVENIVAFGNERFREGKEAKQKEIKQVLGIDE